MSNDDFSTEFLHFKIAYCHFDGRRLVNCDTCERPESPVNYVDLRSEKVSVNIIPVRMINQNRIVISSKNKKKN